MERSVAIRRVFDLALGGHGCAAVAERMNSEGVPPMGRAKRWHGSAVHSLLTSYPKVKDVIGMDEFMRVTIHLRREGRRGRRDAAINNLFSGIVVNREGVKYYMQHCNRQGGTRYSYLKLKGRDGPRIPYAPFEEAFLDYGGIRADDRLAAKQAVADKFVSITVRSVDGAPKGRSKTVRCSVLLHEIEIQTVAGSLYDLRVDGRPFEPFGLREVYLGFAVGEFLERSWRSHDSFTDDELRRIETRADEAQAHRLAFRYPDGKRYARLARLVRVGNSGESDHP